MLAALIVLVVCITTSSAFYCPTEPVFTQTTDDETQTFRLNTMTLCENQAKDSTEVVNICNVGDLNRLLSLAKYHIRAAIEELDSTVMMPRSLCEIHPMDISVSSGHSVASTLTNGFSLIKEITLNMTIVSCHRRSRLFANLFQPMRAIICEMKRLCTDLVQYDAFDVQLDMDSMDRTDLTIFSCKNLRRAQTLLHDFKHDLNSDIANVPTYTMND